MINSRNSKTTSVTGEEESQSLVDRARPPSPEFPNSPVFPKESDPQPPKGSTRTWAIALMAILLAGGLGFWQGRRSTGVSAEPQAAEQPRPVPIKFTTIEPTTLQETSSKLRGDLEAQQKAILRAEVEGRVVEIYVQPGDFVEAGDLIAGLDRRQAEVDFSEAEARLNRAEARLAQLKVGTREEEIAQAKARVAQAEARLQQVQANLDQLEAGTRWEEIAEAEASLSQAQARVEESRSRLDLAGDRVRRNRQLETDGAISRDTLDVALDEERRAQATLEEAKAEVAQEQRRLERLKNGSRPEEIDRAQGEVATAQAEVEEVRQGLRELENGFTPEEIAQAQADVALALADLEASDVGLQDTVIVAPITGIVGDIIPKVGDYLDEGDELTAIIQDGTLELNAQVPIQEADGLRLDLPVDIFESDGESRLGIGRVSFIAPQVSEAQTVPIKVTLDNPLGKLRDRQFVSAKIVWRERSNVIVIPSNAIIFQGDRRLVYLAQGSENMVAKQQWVELGMNQGDRTEILQGLNPGDRLIVSGLQKLTDGKLIQESEN